MWFTKGTPCMKMQGVFLLDAAKAGLYIVKVP